MVQILLTCIALLFLAGPQGPKKLVQPQTDPLGPILTTSQAKKAARAYNQGRFSQAATWADQALRTGDPMSPAERVALRFLRALSRVRAGHTADPADLIQAMNAPVMPLLVSHSAWYQARQLWDRGLSASGQKSIELARPYLEAVGFPGRFGLEARGRLIRGLQATGRLEDACLLAHRTAGSVYRRFAEAQATLNLASCRERAAWAEARLGEHKLSKKLLAQAAGLYRVVAVLWPESWAGPVAKKNLGRLSRKGHKPTLPREDLLKRARDIVDRPMGLRDLRRLWRVRSLLPWNLKTAMGAEAELLWAELSTRHRRFKRAWRSATRVRKKSKDPQLQARAAMLLARLTARRRSAPAIDMYRQVVRTWPESDVAAEALYKAGEISRRHGRARLAQSLFTTCAQKYGQQAAADLCRWGLAWAAFRKQDYRVALTWLEPLTKRPDLFAAQPDLTDLVEEEGAAEGPGDARDELNLVADGAEGEGDMDPEQEAQDELAEVRRHAYRLRQRARYWQARIMYLSGDQKGARAGYRRVLDAHPFSYYALLAWNRLVEMGQTIALDRSASRLEEPGDSLHPEVAAALAYYRMGLLGECRTTLRALRRTDLEHAIDRRWAAILRERLGDYTRSHRIAPVPRDGGLPDYPSDGWRIDAQLAYPRAFSEVIESEFRDPLVPVNLLYALVRVESGFWAEARSPANARGLTQVITRTAWTMAKKLKLKRFRRWKLYQPETSVKVGSAYLAFLLKRYAHPALAIASYNAGERAVDRWLNRRGTLQLDAFVEEIPYEETARYTRRVLSWWAIYRTLYEKDLSLPLDVSFSLKRQALAGSRDKTRQL